ITTAIVGRAGQSSGVGLAIPASTARRVVDELIRFGRVVRADCGVLRVYETGGGVRVGRLAPDGPAERAGLRGPEVREVQRGPVLYRAVDRSRADLIVAVDGRPVKSFDDLLSQVERHKPGETAVFTVVRDGDRVEVPVELEQVKD